MADLHLSLKNLTNNRPALVLSIDAVRGLLLKNFSETAKYLRGKSIPVEGYRNIKARLLEPVPDLNSLRFYINTEGDEVFFVVDQEVSMKVALHALDDANLKISIITIKVTDLKMPVTVSAPNLVIGTPDFDVNVNIKPADSRSDALKSDQVEEDDILRIERSMACLMPRRVVASILSTIRSIDLAKRFPAFELRGNWSIHVVGDNLVILPSGGIEIRQATGCPTKDSVPDLAIKAHKRRPNGGNGFSWVIDHEGIPPSPEKPKKSRAMGFAALYAPKPIWNARFSKVMPGVNYREGNDGFIGYDISFNVGLKYLKLEMDSKREGIIIELQLSTTGAAFLTVDVPCIGRSDLASVRFECLPSDLEILLCFTLQHEGKLMLEGQIDRLMIGRMDAKVRFFSRWLALAGGKAAVVGFILDHALKRIIERNLPTKIRYVIKQEVNSKNFALLDFEELAMFTEFGRFNEVTFSGDDDSVLVGLGSQG